MSEVSNPTIEQKLLKKDHLEPFKIGLIAVEGWLAFIALSDIFMDDVITLFQTSAEALVSFIL